MSTVRRHCRTERPRAYGGQTSSSGTGSRRRELLGGDVVEPGLELGGLRGAHVHDLVEGRIEREVEPVRFAVGLDVRPDAHRCEPLRRAQAAAPEPRVVDEDQVAHRLRRRPLVVHAAALDAGRTADPLDRGGEAGAELPRCLAQIGGVLGADQHPHRMTPVELRFDVPGDLDTVHHQVGDEPVDHGVLQDDADQARPGQIALAELRAVQVLVDIPRHARILVARLGTSAG